MSMTSTAWQTALVVILCQSIPLVADDEPLHVLIDRHLQSRAGLEPVICSDAEFYRRVSLDLIGMPPTADQARAFLVDSDPDKRKKLIGRLLASPYHPRHLANVIDLQLMERRANTNVPQDQWHAWLLSSFQQNRPWNEMARELLVNDGTNAENRAPVRFTLDRNAEPNLLVRDISRTLLGRDLQCAQCHNHPLVDDYHQADYHGLLAFVSPGYEQSIKEGDKTKKVYAERAGGDLKFESVFLKGTPHRTGARLPYGITVDEPFYLPGEEYAVAPADNVRSVPKFSRRNRLAELMTSGEYRLFNENIANRLWAVLMGRGLVHPLDFHHPENPPADPELMRLLGERFAAMKFDVRRFLREVALSSVYQRSIDLPLGVFESAQTASSRLSALQQQRAEIKDAADQSYSAFNERLAVRDEAEAALIPVALELDTARGKYAEARKKRDEAAKARTQAVDKYKARQATSALLDQTTDLAKKSAAQLPDDKELSAAAAKFEERAAAIKAEVESLKKVADEKQAVLDPLETALADVGKTVAEIRGRLEPLQKTLATSDAPLADARRKMASESRQLAHFDRQIRQLETLVAFGQIEMPWREASEKLARLEAELAPLEQAGSELRTQRESTGKELAAAAEDVSTTKKSRDELAARLITTKQQAELVTAAAAASIVAAQLDAGESGVAAAADVLNKRAEGLSSAMNSLTKQVTEAAAKHESAVQGQQRLLARMKGLELQLSQMDQPWKQARQAVSEARDQLTAKDAERAAVLDQLSQAWTRDFTIAAFKPLTPEQLGWSIFQVTGLYSRHWQAEVAELDKSAPLTEDQKKDPGQLAARLVKLEQKTFDKLKGSVGVFIQFYGAGAGQPQGDFFATADQALFAANAGQINGWTAASGDNVTQRIIKATEPRVAAEELYLSILTRMPTSIEITEVAEYLSQRKEDRTQAAQELVWSLLNAAEFRFNH